MTHEKLVEAYKKAERRDAQRFRLDPPWFPFGMRFYSPFELPDGETGESFALKCRAMGWPARSVLTSLGWVVPADAWHHAARRGRHHVR